MDVVGVIRPLETREVSASGADWVEARANLEAAVPDGWVLIQVRQVR